MKTIRQTKLYMKWYARLKDRMARMRIAVRKGNLLQQFEEVDMKTKLYKWNIEDSLKTPEDRAAYIEAAMEANDPEFMSIALGDVAKAEGMSKVARKANVTRENLYRAFAPGGNPTITTVMRVLNALGLTIRIAPAGVS